MNKRLMVFMAAVLIVASQAAAELIHGTFNFLSCGPGFDFSERSCTTDHCLADVGLAEINPPVSCTAVMTCFCFCSCDALSVVAIFPGFTLADVEWAPADSVAYGCGDCVAANTVYVIHTADGLYAKFAFTNPPPFLYEVEYYVQTDGTRNLGGVPVTESRWGEVKARYE
jgi:hypothetical protein